MTFMTSDGWIGAVLLPKPCLGILREKSYIHEGEREKEKEKKPGLGSRSPVFLI